MNTQLSKIKLLLLRDFALKRRSTVIFILVLLGLLTLFTLMSGRDAQEGDTSFFTLWYGIFFFIAGIFHIGSSFFEFSSPSTRQDYLLVPASHLDKWTARWMLTLPIFILGFTIVYFMATWIANGFNYIVVHETVESFNPLSAEVLTFWKIFIVVHAIFFVGAIHFNKSSTFKTFLVLFILNIGVFFILTMVQKILYVGVDESQFFVESIRGISWISERSDLAATIAQIVIWGMLVPFLWLVSYLKLKEKEV